MKKAVYNILPETEDILKTMGEQIKLARFKNGAVKFDREELHFDVYPASD